MLVVDPMRLAGVIRPRASWFFWGGIAVLHGLALGVLVLVDLKAGPQFAVLSLVLCSALLAFAQWRATRGVVFRLADDGVAYCQGDDGEPERAVQFSEDTRDLGVILVLAWSETGSSSIQRMCVPRDALTAAEWRLLRAWLRWRRPMAGGSSVADPSANADSG